VTLLYLGNDPKKLESPVFKAFKPHMKIPLYFRVFAFVENKLVTALNF
jgi:hypothetical protein